MDAKGVVTSAAIGAGAAALVAFLLLRGKGPSKDTTESDAALREQIKDLQNSVRFLTAKLQEPPAMSPRSGLASASPSRPVIPVVSLLRSQQKKILVTGGAGFVGSHLVDALMMQVSVYPPQSFGNVVRVFLSRFQGHIVYVLDNLFTGRRKNLEHWFGHPNFHFFQHDVVNPFHIEVSLTVVAADPWNAIRAFTVGG